MDIKERLSRRGFIKWAGRSGVGIGLSFLLGGDSAPRPPETFSSKPLALPVTPKVEPEKSQEVPKLFDVLIAPFAGEAQKRREARAKTEFSKRVDSKLNEGRINFLLFGYGETHEPPRTERALIGSYTIISYNLQTKTVDFVSLTHDIRAPEIERYQSKEEDYPVRGAIKIDQAWKVGGFPLMREVLENATGLSIDFQVKFKDETIKEAVDQVFGTIEIDLPFELWTNPFYLDEVKYEEGYFPKGKQTFDGTKVIQFIKTVAKEEKPRKETEHNARKHLVFEAMLAALEKRSTDPHFWLSASKFLKKELKGGRMAFDFEVKELLLHNLWEIGQNVGRYLLAEGQSKLFPKMGKKIYIHDPAHGEGGVRWVNSEASQNPIIRKEIESGVYPDLAMAVPYGADPRAEDLVGGYWPSVRRLVKKSLTGWEEGE